MNKGEGVLGLGEREGLKGMANEFRTLCLQQINKYLESLNCKYSNHTYLNDLSSLTLNMC